MKKEKKQIFLKISRILFEQPNMKRKIETTCDCFNYLVYEN